MITLKEINKIYRTDEIETVALENVNLEVEKGEFLSIMGLLDLPTSGVVEIEGIQTAGMKDKALAAFRNQKLGFVFQSFHLINSVKSNVMRIANSAYYTGPGEYKLFVADGNDRIVKRTVKLGEAGFDYVEVINGLKPGDKVVVSDMNDYKEKSELKVKK